MLKTTAMFTGEIDFSDIPIEGKNASVYMAYFYLLVFVVVVVLVLMNLLNALAVSDISEVMKSCEMEFMLSNMQDVSCSTDKTLTPIDIILSILSLISKIILRISGFELLRATKRNGAALRKINATSGKYELR